MRYATLKGSAGRYYRIKNIDGGLSTDASADKADDNKLCECLNMWSVGGKLKTRPAVCCVSAPLEQISQYETTAQGLTLTDTVYCKNGVQYKLAYFITHDGASFVKIYFYLIEAGGQSLPIGTMIFNRISTDEFYVPKSVFFAVGNPTVGAGIYAFITRKSGENEQYNIYEASKTLDSWLDCRDNFYVPVLYINGLGTRYGEAREAHSLSYPNPEYPEQRNLLTGWFKAYFTSDGISSVFKLPVSNIDGNTAVWCRIYSDSKNYTEWVIPVNADQKVQSFGSVEITMKCDRKAGVISFYQGDAPYGIPIMPYCSSNNILIKACKEVSYGLAAVTSSKKSLVYNSRFFVCGNTKRTNEVYSARLSNPLYFPKGAKTAVGDSVCGVNALGVQSNKVIVFKDNETYRIDIDGGRVMHDAALIDENDELGGTDTLSSVAISQSIGCDCPDTVRRCGNRLVWVGSDGKLYMLASTTYGKENNIYTVSYPVGDGLSRLGRNALRSAFGVVSNGYYMLFSGNEVWLLYHRVKSFGFNPNYQGGNSATDDIAWYYWRLPDGARFVSGASFAENCLLGAVDSSGLWNYCAVFNAGRDRIITGDRRGFTVSELDIDCGYATPLLDFGFPEKGKRIDSAALEISMPRGGKVTFFNNECRWEQGVSPCRGILRLTSVPQPIDKIGVRVQSRGDIEQSSITFKYKLLSDLR